MQRNVSPNSSMDDSHSFGITINKPKMGNVKQSKNRFLNPNYPRISVTPGASVNSSESHDTHSGYISGGRRSVKKIFFLNFLFLNLFFFFFLHFFLFSNFLSPFFLGEIFCHLSS